MARHPDPDAASLAARRAARSGDWRTVANAADQILRQNPESAEGHFLAGLSAKSNGILDVAEKSLARVLAIDDSRYDAGVELADLYVRLQRTGEAVALLRRLAPLLATSPLYLEMAAFALTRLDLHEEALPLYRRACELQPEIERFRTGLANCLGYLGQIREATGIYADLLRRHPQHQRFHFELSRLRTATDEAHVEQMKEVLEATRLPAARNIFIYYALGKELEDLGQWDEAFRFYKKAGDAVKSIAPYDVSTDLRLIDALVRTCDASWLQDVRVTRSEPSQTPVFVVGLPRSGTTLTERILASHTAVGSIGETFFFETALRRACGAPGAGKLPAEMIERAAAADPGELAARYLEAVEYKLGEEPFFVEKYPENFLYLGFIARAFPAARIVRLTRHPMDACFALYKQSYFRFAYSLEDLGRFYVAYDRLMKHWGKVLGERIIEVRYEELVTQPESTIHDLLAGLGLPFEAGCLSPERHRASSRTASSIQIRESIHPRSVDRWRNFERHLAPLAEYLEAQGIET